jgi:hypothetical protein
MEKEKFYKKLNNQMDFEESLGCKGCKYCLSGKYYHPLGYSFAIKRIAGKREAWIIGLGILIPSIIFAIILFTNVD